MEGGAGASHMNWCSKIRTMDAPLFIARTPACCVVFPNPTPLEPFNRTPLQLNTPTSSSHSPLLPSNPETLQPLNPETLKALNPKPRALAPTPRPKPLLGPGVLRRGLSGTQAARGWGSLNCILCPRSTHTPMWSVFSGGGAPETLNQP